MRLGLKWVKGIEVQQVQTVDLDYPKGGVACRIDRLPREMHASAVEDDFTGVTIR